MDHEGNVSPWIRLAEERDLEIRWLTFNRDSWRIEPEDLKPLLNERTRLLALNYASNLTGSINPVAALTRMAKQAGALVYLDAVQFVPHGKAEVMQLGCDFLACSSYKFFGPHLGILWGREALLAEVYRTRCAVRRRRLQGVMAGTPQTEMLAAWRPRWTPTPGWVLAPALRYAPRADQRRLPGGDSLRNATRAASDR
jgi:selenocysteine lyase/cysteine desulfurase